MSNNVSFSEYTRIDWFPPFLIFSLNVFTDEPYFEAEETDISGIEKQKLLAAEYAAIGGHPGYIDAELLGLTTLSLERCKDLEMLTSDEIKNWVKDNNIEFITYYDLVKELEGKE